MRLLERRRRYFSAFGVAILSVKLFDRRVEKKKKQDWQWQTALVPWKWVGSLKGST
jgi:hypothetical protein